MATVYEIVTDVIVKALDKGRIPWVRPWNTREAYNVVSGKPYNGINALLLNTVEDGPGFITYKQAIKLHGKVERGLKWHPVVYYANWNDKEDNKRFALRFYKVTPVKGILGLPEKYYDKQMTINFEPDKTAEEVIDQSGAEITYGSDKACYSTIMDKISMPNREDFHSKEEFYNTMFHELIHWTGHKSRENRDMSGRNKAYSFEELIAEIGGAFTYSKVGLNFDVIAQNTSAYCQNWAKYLKENGPNIINKAAAQARKASERLIKVE